MPCSDADSKYSILKIEMSPGQAGSRPRRLDSTKLARAPRVRQMTIVQ